VLIGIDFDNTIVCYDRLFRAVAVERGLIPTTVPASKQAVRDWLRQSGRESDWTELQGIVYGSRMADADMFPGVQSFFRRCRRADVPARIISHRSRFPYRGEPHDLHAAARKWLAASGIDIEPGEAFFELTIGEKLTRIAEQGCTHFVDDLPELFAEPAFCVGVERILFDPNAAHLCSTSCQRFATWADIENYLLSGAA
jgi:hypothetical protein